MVCHSLSVIIFANLIAVNLGSPLPHDSQPMSPPPTPPRPPINNHHCSHLLSFISNPTTRSLSSLHRCLRPFPLGRLEIRRDPYELPQCSLCFNSSPRLFACLLCAAVLCPLHLSNHDRSHHIAIDISRAELFCFSCRDQIYHTDFDASALFCISADRNSTVSSSSSDMIIRLKKKNRFIHGEQKDVAESESIPKGLRGMNNLGNTCFMSSVLQVFMHTEPLRNFFLSDSHNKFVCQQAWRKEKVSCGKRDVDNGRILCLACDLDDMYSDVFSSGDHMPHSPASFLCSWWQHAMNLASYEQQDAHEFFISILDGIHEKLVGEQNRSQHQSNGNCCIAHKVFSFTLRSDVICSICGSTSTTYEPGFNISLDLDHHIQSSAKAPTKSSRTNTSSSVSTLMGCLQHYTRPERLHTDQKVFCQYCQVGQDSFKQMSIKKLPLVACFHIKRFEHSAVRKMSRKLDQYLQFPFSLNMAPYLSSSILRSRCGNRVLTTMCESDEFITSEFELFAMITHSGKLNGGHYSTYLRLNGQWYNCDDAWVTHVSEYTVRASQAYMLFYVQKRLYYKASQNMISS